MEDPNYVQLLDKFLDFLNDFETEGQQPDIWSRHAFLHAYRADPSVEWIDKRCTMRAIKYVKLLAVWFYNVEWSGIDANDRVLASLVRDTKFDFWMMDVQVAKVVQGGDIAHGLPQSLFYIARLCCRNKGFLDKLEKLPHAVDGKVFDEFTESVMQYVMDVPGHDYYNHLKCFRDLLGHEKMLQAVLSILYLAGENDSAETEMSLKLSPCHNCDAWQLYLQALFPVGGSQDVVESFLNLLQSAQTRVRFLDYILQDSLKIDPAPVEILLKHVDCIISSIDSPHHRNLMLKLRLIKAQLFCTAAKTNVGTIGEASTFLTDKFFKTPSMHMTDQERLLLQLIQLFLKDTAASLCDSAQVSEDMILESSLAIFMLYKIESFILLFTNEDGIDTLHERSTFRDLLSGGTTTMACKSGQNDQTVQLPCQLSSETELNLEESIAVYEQGSWSLFNDFITSDRVVYAPHHLFGKLRRLLTNKPHTFSAIKDQIVTLLGEMEFLGSILTDVNNKGAGLRVLYVLYEVEYIVDMFLRGDSPAWYQQLLIFNALEDTNLIKEQMLGKGSFELPSMLTTTDDQARSILDLLHSESRHPETMYYFLKEFEDGGAREYWRNYVYSNYVLKPSVHWIDEESTKRATTFLKTVQFFYNAKHGGNDEDEHLAAQCQRRTTYLKWLHHEHNVCEDDPCHLAAALSESFGALGVLHVKFADTCNQLMKVPVPARFSDGDMFGDLVDSVQWYLMQRHYKVIVPVLEQFRNLVCRLSNTCTDQKRLQSLLPPAVTVVFTILQMAFRNETYTGQMEEATGSKTFLNLIQAAQRHAHTIGAILDFPIMDLIANQPDNHSEQVGTLLKQGYTEVANERLVFELILSFLRDTTSLELVYNTTTGTLENGNISASCVAVAVMNEMSSARKIEFYFEEMAAVYARDLLWMFNNFPRIDSIFFVEHLLEKLRMFATNMPDTNTFMKDEFQAFLKNLEFFALFINESKNKDVGLCVTFLLYAAEYIVDMFILGDGPLCYHQLVLFIAIKEVELIKARILDCSNDNETSELPLQDDQLTLDNNKSNSGNLKTEEVVVGLDDHANNIVELLETGSKNLQVLSIVGMAGIGKTTLAKKVYNILLSKGRFAVCAGSSVSQVYRKRELLLEILADFTVVTNDVKKMDDNDLAQTVFRSLKGKRYLILLDDIWRIEDWSDLRLSFPDDKKGSRILFTTRVRSVAEEANNTIPKIGPYILPLLSVEQSWDLLKEKVFPGGRCPEKLLEVGRLVAKDCKGLPLAIVVIGGILGKVQDQKDKWEEIARHLRLRVADSKETKFMGILELSYNHLPSYLKPCFLYLGSFLEDQDIPVKKLQWLWMGEGFIPRNDTKSLEETAGGYFIELINRSLLMESKRCSLGSVKTCRIHDMLRDLCLKKSREENFMQLISMNGSNESESPMDMQYRVCVHSSDQNFIQFKPSSSHPRSLLFFSTETFQDRYRYRYDISSIFQDYKLVRVLDLEPIIACFFPRGADLLIFLTYLAIKGNMSSVPSSISKLRNLEILIVNGDGGEIALPSSLWSMSTLRHVHVHPRACLTLSSPELENATIFPKLISFSCPVVSDWNEDKKILKRLIGLKYLRCKFLELKHWDSDRRRYVFPDMEFLTQLESLNVSHMRNILSCEFSFPLNLKKLTLSGFCFAWDYMSVIIRLPKLEVLKLLSRAFKGNTWDMTEEIIFPELKYLKFCNLDITDWNNSMDCSDHFPSLERLVLSGCEELVAVPSCFGEVPTLQVIEMQFCSKSAEHSVKGIFEQQLEYNNDFKVMITPSLSIVERFHQKSETGNFIGLFGS